MSEPFVVRLSMVIRTGSPVARASQKSYVERPVVAPVKVVVVRMCTVGTGVPPTSTVSCPTTRPGPCSFASPVEQETLNVLPGRTTAGRNGVPVQVYVVLAQIEDGGDFGGQLGRRVTSDKLTGGRYRRVVLDRTPIDRIGVGGEEHVGPDAGQRRERAVEVAVDRQPGHAHLSKSDRH